MTTVAWLNAAVLDLLDRELLEEYIEILRQLRVQVCLCLRACVRVARFFARV